MYANSIKGTRVIKNNMIVVTIISFPSVYTITKSYATTSLWKIEDTLDKHNFIQIFEVIK